MFSGGFTRKDTIKIKILKENYLSSYLCVSFYIVVEMAALNPYSGNFRYYSSKPLTIPNKECDILIKQYHNWVYVIKKIDIGVAVPQNQIIKSVLLTKM